MRAGYRGSDGGSEAVAESGTPAKAIAGGGSDESRPDGEDDRRGGGSDGGGDEEKAEGKGTGGGRQAFS